MFHFMQYIDTLPSGTVVLEKKHNLVRIYIYIVQNSSVQQYKLLKEIANNSLHYDTLTLVSRVNKTLTSLQFSGGSA